MFEKEIDTKGATGPSEIKLNANPTTDPTFAIEQILLFISFRLTNANVGAAAYTTEADWSGVKVKILKRDNTPIVNSVSAKTLEGLVQQITCGFPFAPAKFKDLTVPGSGTNGGVLDVNIGLVIPFRLALALQQSTDTDLSFDLIGDCSVTIPAPTAAGVTMSQVTVALIAGGHRDHNGHVKIAPTLEFNEHSCTNSKDDTIALGNGRLLALQLMSGDKSEHPISDFSGVQLKIDNGLPIVDLPNKTLQFVALTGGDLLGTPPSDNVREGVTHAAPLFSPRKDSKMSELPTGASAQVHFTTLANGIPNGVWQYGTVILRDPPVAAALSAIPAFRDAWNKHGPEKLGEAGIVHRPTIDGSANVPAHIRRSLPLHLRLPGIAPGA